MNIYFKIVAHHQIWWCDQLKDITAQVNKELGTKFNTILLNKYKDGNDCIGFHRDRETGWAANSGFATLAFGAERDFQVKNECAITQEWSSVVFTSANECWKSTQCPKA